MSPIVPAPASGRPSLADVFPSIFAATQGNPSPLSLPTARSAAVLLVDGLGHTQLTARTAYARFLGRTLAEARGPAAGRGSMISTVFPSTTAAALTSLTTGTMPGEHGIVGYATLDPDDDRIVNQLSGWDERMDPGLWQRRPTVFETALGRIPSVVVGPERYADSGFTAAVLRGARYVPAKSMRDRVDRTLEAMAAGPALVYCYFPELDQAGHSEGWDSERWSAALEELDGAVAALARGLHPEDGALLTADHGMVDVAAHEQVVLSADSPLFDGVRHTGGEPRGLQLYFEPEADAVHRAAVLDAWRAAEGHRAWVLGRDEAIEGGLFGPVDEAVRPRIGDILIAARKRIAYYRDDAKPSSRTMIGQHGSLSPEEIIVPLLRFGRFA